MTKSKTKIMSLVFALMLCFGTLFASVTNRTVTANAESKTVTQVSGNVYEDSEHNKYFKQTVFGSDGVNTFFESTILVPESGLNYMQYTFGSTTLSNGEKVLDAENGIKGQDRFFAYEPIVWQVLSVDENGIALVVSDKVLANMAFQPTYTTANDGNYTWTTNANDANGANANIYQYSNLRYWLNGMPQTDQTGNVTDTDGNTLNTDMSGSGEDVINSNQLGLSIDLGYPTFLQTAFSSSEQSKIKISSGIGASDATTYVPAGSGDKIFLLSKADATNASYFAGNSARIKKTTDLAKASYVTDGSQMMEGMADPTAGGAWWLRSPFSSYSRSADFVSEYGSAYGGIVDRFWYGVVPALFLDTTGIQAYSDSSCATEANIASGKYLQFGSWPQTVADVTESAEGGSSGSGSSGSGAGSGSEVSSTGIDINLIGLYFGMGAVAVSAVAITKVLNKNKKELKK